MDPRLNPDLPYREKPGASPAPRFDLIAAAIPPADSSASTAASASPYSSTSAKVAYAAAYARPASTRPKSASDDDSAKLRTARAEPAQPATRAVCMRCTAKSRPGSLITTVCTRYQGNPMGQVQVERSC